MTPTAAALRGGFRISPSLTALGGGFRAELLQLLRSLLLIALTFRPTFQTQPIHVILFIPSLVLAAALVLLSVRHSFHG